MVFNAPSNDGHAQISFFRDPESGLQAIIALHRFTNVPALGGCRMRPYASEDEALTDALRLARGMSYKTAMANVPFMGGKSVIIGDPAKDKTPALLRAFARCINTFNGRYITGEDMGMTIPDVVEMKRYSPWLVGDQSGGEERLGVTAEGVFRGICAAVAYRLGRRSLDGISVAIQGVGKVGIKLAAKLKDAGCQLIIADADEARAALVAEAVGARMVSAAEIGSVDADVFSPCAMGGIINHETLPGLRARIIAGAANNQLSDAAIAEALREQGILYAPDYVINAGGMMNVAEEVIGYDETRLRARIHAIADTLTDIFETADRDGVTTLAASDRIAEERIARLIASSETR